MDDLAEAAERVLGHSPEPLPTRLLAVRVLEEADDRPVLAYEPHGAFAPGDRIAWRSPYGILVGDVVACELVREQARLVVQWDPRMSPGLERYLKKRAGSRIFYVYDPTSSQAPEFFDPVNGSGEGPTILDLLELELAEKLHGRHGFADWAGSWCLWRQLPRLDRDDLERSLLNATADDGIAQTNQVLELMHLPGPDETGYGFAALAVNKEVQERGGWAWGGNRDGGEWLPETGIAKVFALLGPAPRVEEEFRTAQVPSVPDEELPEPLARLLVDQAVKELDIRGGRGRLVHVLSRWERLKGVIALDQAELNFFPEQARILLSCEGATSFAIIQRPARLLRPESDDVHTSLRMAAEVHFTRLGGPDTFAVRFVGTAEDTGPDPTDVVGLVTHAFADGRPHSAEEVLRSVSAQIPGDRAVIARLVCAVLATYACFESTDDVVYRYHPQLPHNARLPVRMGRVADLATRSERARHVAETEDRNLRQLRLARAAHTVRGHMRRLRRSRHASLMQVAIARRHGLTIPDGFTFVRPHRRRG